MSRLERMSLAWRPKEPFPAIRPAGKVLPVGVSAQACLQEITQRPLTPPAVRKFLSSSHPAPGMSRVFHGKADDPDVASTLVHGVSRRPSISALSVIIPPPETQYQERLREIQEAIYRTRQKAPLGKSQVLGPGLPNGVHPEKTTFGVKSAPTFCAGDLINPPKTAEQEEHRNYVRSHNSYSVGERVNRGYDSDAYRRCSRFGVTTPHRNDGHNASRSLRWHSDVQKTNLVSKRYEDFRERTQPQIGKVHHRFVESSRLPLKPRSRVLPPQETFGAGDLQPAATSSESLGSQSRCRTLVSAVRQHLKKANFHNFSSLLQAFRHYDKKNQGKIDKDDLRDTCSQFNLDLTEDILDELMKYCDVDQDGFINFLEFANFLNWKEKMPITRAEQQILTGAPGSAPAGPLEGRPQLLTADMRGGAEVLVQAEDLEPIRAGSILRKPKTLSRGGAGMEHYLTSSSSICAVVGERPGSEHQTYGVPTVRTDLAAPRIRRISDRTNYGDQSTVYDLLCPPLHSLFGVHEEHYLSSRTKNEMLKICRNVGVQIPDEVFEKVWSSASIRHPTGEVCVESFRNVLNEL